MGKPQKVLLLFLNFTHMHQYQQQTDCINDPPHTTTEPDNLLNRFFRLALINVLSNLLVPIAGLISIAF
ncbi:MAG: hypothetical protein WBG73_19035 [Coleofasciculaceae cyanobacterium]